MVRLVWTHFWSTLLHSQPNVDFCIKNNISTTLITLVSSWTIGHNSRPKCWEISHNTVRLRGTTINKTTFLPRFYEKGSKTSFLKWPSNDIGLACLKFRAAPLWLSEQRSRHGETCAFFAQLGKKHFLFHLRPCRHLRDFYWAAYHTSDPSTTYLPLCKKNAVKNEKKTDWVFARVSVQGVKSLGVHFACLCRGFDFYEVKKKDTYDYSSKRKKEILLNF